MRLPSGRAHSAEEAPRSLSDALERGSMCCSWPVSSNLCAPSIGEARRIGLGRRAVRQQAAAVAPQLEALDHLGRHGMVDAGDGEAVEGDVAKERLELAEDTVDVAFGRTTPSSALSPSDLVSSRTPFAAQRL